MKIIAPVFDKDFAEEQWGSGPFLRFGKWPKDELSKIHYGDYQEYTHEPGVSVYPAFFDKAKHKWAVDCEFQLVCRDNASSNYSRASHGLAKIFLVTGDIVSRGTDGEPVIRNVKKIKELHCSEVYIPRYNYDILPHCNPAQNWKTLITECRNIWERYYRKPTKKNLLAVFLHLDKMKKSNSKSVKKERSKCLRAANKEKKRIKL